MLMQASLNKIVGSPSFENTSTTISDRSNFDWEKIGDAYFPVVYRDGKKFVSVRMVEKKLLSQFPKVVPNELTDMKKCPSYYLTEEECDLLDHLRSNYCKGEYGIEKFTLSDTIVELSEFKGFYELVCDTTISELALEVGLTKGGWVQINNTVCPFVWHSGIKYLPYDLLSLAAELLFEKDSIPKVKVTSDELKFLNELCEQADRTFLFDQNTDIVSLLRVKQLCNPLILELPSDRPFENAIYVDPDLDEQKKDEMKTLAKEAMNAYYNSIILNKFKQQKEQLKNGSPHSNPKNSPPQFESISVINPSLHDMEYRHAEVGVVEEAAETLLSGQNSKEPCPGTASRELSCVVDSNSSKLGIVQPIKRKRASHSCRSPDSKNPNLKNPQRGHVKGSKRKSSQSGTETRENLSKIMRDKYKVNVLSDCAKNQRYLLTSQQNLDEIMKELPNLFMLYQELSSYDFIDRAALQLMNILIDIHYSVSSICSKAYVIVEELLMAPNSINPAFGNEAKAVLCDASLSYSFWNASAHRITLGAADILNSALVKACLDNSPLSFQKRPDISHFMVAGMFGARTFSAAANFRFLQVVMCIAIIALNKAEVPVSLAFNITSTHFNEIVELLNTWCNAVAILPDTTVVAYESFVSNVYTTFDIAYGSTKSPITRPTMSQTVIQSLIASSDSQAYQTSGGNLFRHLPSPFPTTKPSEISPQPGQYEQHSKLFIEPFERKPNNQLNTGQGFLLPHQCFTVSKMPDATIPAQPTKIPLPVPLVCPVVPYQVANIHHSDLVSLVRKNGKKIPMFKKSGWEWFLVEDVQKTYYPRTYVRDFLKFHLSLHGNIFLPLSTEADKAFRHHYNMSSADQFEVPLMLSGQSLHKILENSISVRQQELVVIE